MKFFQRKVNITRAVTIAITRIIDAHFPHMDDDERTDLIDQLVEAAIESIVM